MTSENPRGGRGKGLRRFGLLGFNSAWAYVLMLSPEFIAQPYSAMPKKLSLAKASTRPARSFRPLLSEVRVLILAAREQVARAVDAGLVTLYWHIGRRIRQDILNEKRAEYGVKIVAALGRQLENEFGRGFTAKNLHRMVQFAEVFPEETIVAALRRQLGWTHFRMIIPLEDDLKRDFYAEMCRIEKWSTRTLEKKIGGM